MSAPPKDRRRFRSRGVSGVVRVAIALGAATTCASAPAEDCALLQVTIHNENSGQNFSPPVVVVHRPDFSLFRVGEPASDSLWHLAEDGQTDGYTALAGTHPDVVAVVVAPPAHRKRSPVVSTAVTACAGQRVSVAAMLGATNDGFVAARNVRIPDAPGEVVRAALLAFDAGSEANTESCDHVPCTVHGHRMTDGAEGSVRPHPGLRGDRDIPPERGWSGNVLGHVTLRHSEDR